MDKNFQLTDNVEVFYEKRVTPFGNSAKLDAPKKYIGKRAYVIILKDWPWNFVPMSFALDYYLYKANILLTDYRKRATIIDYIIKNPALFMIDESAGFVDLELNFFVKNPKHFHEIMEDLKSRFSECIKDYNYFYIEKFHKYQYIPEI